MKKKKNKVGRPSMKTKTVKRVRSVRVSDQRMKLIIKKYGSLQAAIDGVEV